MISRLRRYRPSPASLLLGLLVAAAFLLGMFQPAERLLGDLNFRLYTRPASGGLVLVEIDSRSLQTLNTWPWSRAYHAALIQRLAKSGAATIAFDVDFSAASAPAGDAALAKALAAADRPVILAAFAQLDQASGDARVLTNLPLPEFRALAQVGMVNVFADVDGRPRRYRLIEDRLPGAPVSMARRLDASAARNVAPNDFGIDYGIDPATIPRISYVDVLTGRFNPAQVRGKTVLVGSTAVELGDRFSVPARGFLAGVEIQALAYESLTQGRMLRPLNAGWVLVGIALLTLCGGLRADGARRSTPILAIGAGCLVFAVGFFAQSRFALSIAIAPWLAMAAGNALLAVLRRARHHARAASHHRLAAMRQKALMEGVFKDSFDGILIVAADGRIEVANPTAGRLLELEPAALVGRSVGFVLNGIRLDRGGATAPVHELTVKASSGRELTVAVAVTQSRAAVSPGQAAAQDDVWIVTFRDESAKRATELAREQTLRELRAATAAKNEFLARVSHELRTPLSAIIGFAGMIGEQRIGPLGNPKHAEYALDIRAGGNRLLDLVNDIIDMVRIEAEQYELSPETFETHSLLASCCGAARKIEGSGTRNLSFEVAPGAAAIRTDRRALTKVLGKLLENAVKFTGPGGNIVLRGRSGPDHGFIIEVEDDGVGIDEQVLKTVTAAFTQGAGGLDRGYEGSGLGLYVAHRVTRLLGGRLEIESRLGAGTTVRLVLPGTLIETPRAA